jgi:AraC-like DNA-binding protein
VETAARLLREGAMPVSAAATHVGFGDPRHFARVFKRMTGVRPREWAAISGERSAEVMVEPGDIN